MNPVPEHAGPSATSRAGGALAGSAATTHTLGVPWEKDVEAAYFRNIPDEALVQSAAKPFSVPDRGRLLVEIGAVLSLLPEPPGRILDLGCGTGWTSSFLARSGYDVVGVDLSPEAVDTARAAFPLPSLAFAIHDFDEPLPRSFGLFDAVVFFDTLHHAEDERRPLRAAYLALRDGGVCVACEPGTGHAVSEGSIHAVATFGVRERDMTPPQVVAAGREAGFRAAAVHPHPHELHRNLYLHREPVSFRNRLLATVAGQAARVLRTVTVQRRHWGIVVLTK